MSHEELYSETPLYDRISREERSSTFEERMKTSEEIKICPRCGEKYSYIRRMRQGSKTYVYAVHIINRKRKYCYLGPEYEYKHFSNIHDITATNLVKQDYLDIALEALQKYYAKLITNKARKDETKILQITEIIEKISSFNKK